MEQRRFTRVLFNNDCVIFDGEKPHAARLLDISIKGALVETPRAAVFQLHTPFDLHIALDGLNEELRIQCTPVHREGDRLGLYFTLIDMESLTHLRALIALNSGDPDKTAEELFFWSGPNSTDANSE